MGSFPAPETMSFNTETLPPADRLKALRTRLDRLVLPGVLYSQVPKARLDVVGAGRSWQVIRFTSSPVTVIHEPEHVASSAPGYLVWLQLRGRGCFRQGGSEIIAKPGQIVVRAENQPSEVHIRQGNCGLLARVPVGGTRLSHAARLPPESGPAVMLRQFLVGLSTLDPQAASEDLDRASTTADELLHAGLDAALPNNSAPLLQAIREIIEERLHDPHLTAANVASVVGTSPRTLHRALHATDTTFRTYITARRLDRCRHDLVYRPHETVATICYRWGFTDLSHFTRRFRDRFGISPGRYRVPIRVPDPKDYKD